jgi:hypothetical protein
MDTYVCIFYDYSTPAPAAESQTKLLVRLKGGGQVSVSGESRIPTFPSNFRGPLMNYEMSLFSAGI